MKWRATWPGGNGVGVPPGFPGTDTTSPRRQLVRSGWSLHARPPVKNDAEADAKTDPATSAESGAETGTRHVRRFRRVRHIPWPGLAVSSVPPDFPVPNADADPDPGVDPEPVFTLHAAPPAPSDSPRRRRRLPRPSLGPVGKVVAAVYAALADPLVGGDEAARELRAARVRRAGTVAGSAALAAVVVYGFFPIRTYLDQRAATQRAREQLDVISRENERLAEQAEELRDPETVEEIARRDYGLVFPGEESYGVLPPPVETTTTTTAPP